ncbi:MAG: ABC transporter substrate-binding protein [Ilumatobacteraceae bacterium]
MRRAVTVVLAVGVLAAAACGQKAGVAGTGGDDSGGVTPTTAGSAETTVDTTPAETTVPGSTTPGETTVPGETTAPDDTTETTAAVPETGPFEPGDNDAAGVSDTEIVIGIHAPVTGASPIPQQSFDVGKDIYWQFLAESAPDRLFGRTVRVVFRDDEFNPQRAVQVCREMVEQDGAFLLVGGGGADQITACAQYANENGIPYLSAGVNETTLADLDTYFSTSLTYAQQAPLIIAQLVEQGFTEAALVVSNTPSFDDAFEAIKAAASEAGIGLLYENRINKDASPAEAQTVVQQLKDAGAEAVILLSSPVVYVLGLAPGAANQSYAPVWIGPGVTSGLNQVAAIGCPAVATGEFFSPTPALAGVDEVDPDYLAAYTQFVGADPPADDIGFQLWSLNKAIATMFEATGQELGRAAFMNTLVTTPEFDNGIYSPLQYTVDDHFGGTGSYLLTTDCDAKAYVTAGLFEGG